MNKPNFLLVGAPKAGTTAVAQFLSEHPDIFMSEIKEPLYFIPDILETTSRKDPMFKVLSNNARLTKEEYYSLFNGVSSERRIGEATVHYLYHYDKVIPKVLSELGDIQIIIVLRDPALRAFSNYSYQSRGQLTTFEESLELEEERINLGYNSFWYYKAVGNYYEPIKAYLASFSYVHICLYEDLQKDPVKFMKDMYAFLNVDSSFVPQVATRHNKTIRPKNKLIHFIYYYKHKLGIRLYLPKSLRNLISKKVFTTKNDKIKPDTYRELQKYFKNDIQKLEKLIQRDLSSWYE